MEIIGVELFMTIIILSGILQFLDSSMGMGYGTSLAPLLLIMGFTPLQVVPSLLLSQTAGGIFAGFFHHEFGNVTFGLFPISHDTKVVGVITATGILATVFSVILAISLPAFYIKLYVGILVIIMGILAFVTIKRTFSFSWARLGGFAALAGFNKGIGGGGYGPILMVGQIISGLKVKQAVGIITMSEGLVSIVAIIAYFIFTLDLAGGIDFLLLPSLVIGSSIGSIASPYVVSKIPEKPMKFLIPTYSIAIGLMMLIKIIW